MRAALRPLLYILLLVGAIAPPAWAARPVLGTAGSSVTELGDASVDVVSFVVLQPGERYGIVVTGRAGERVRVRMLVPDRMPESAAPDRSLPVLEVVGGGAGAPTSQFFRGRRTGVQRSKEPSTGVRLLEVADTSGDGREAPRIGEDGRLQLTVRPGDSPTRVALLVGDERRLELPDAARQPRTVAGIRAWYDTAPDGTPAAGGQSAHVPGRGWIAIPAAVVVAMVALTIWWMLLGSRVGRRRGEERAAERRAEAAAPAVRGPSTEAPGAVDED